MTTQTLRGQRFQDLVAEVKPHIQEIDNTTLKQWLAEDKQFILIDTREPQETAQGVIGDSLTIPRGVLELQIDSVVPDQDDTVVLYCGGGNRSALAAHMIQKMGYENVYSLAGGYKNY